VVKHSAHNPKINGSNPATGKTEIGKLSEKVYKIYGRTQISSRDNIYFADTSLIDKGQLRTRNLEKQGETFKKSDSIIFVATFVCQGWGGSGVEMRRLTQTFDNQDALRCPGTQLHPLSQGHRRVPRVGL
jgi:hypothetical protein